MKTQDNETVWSAPEYNARGQVTAYDLGIDYKVSREYDTYGFPKRIKTRQTGSLNDIENFVYDFDEKRGNLNGRDTYRFYRFEDFTYDALDRLVTETVSSTQHGTSYAANGNITSRTDIGSYEYDQIDAGPHAVTDITTPAGPYAPAANQTVVYSGFNKASLISQNGYSCFITYGPDRLRRRMALDHQGVDQVLLSKYYAFGDFERETNANGTRQLHYIAGGDGLAAIYVKYDTGQDSLFYIMQDHLGSIVGAINSESDHIYRQSFDAWGRERNPITWGYSNLPDDFPFMRGYTGHEHLKWFGLVNMNGRMYDAGLCRFLSPDPYVQMPDNSQNFNRYSYCLNNPLVYTDPSGEFIHFIIGAAIGGTLNWIMNGAEFSWKGLGYFGIGAAAGALSAGVGAGVGAALAGNAAAGGGFAAGFIGSSSITSTGFLAGAISGGASGFTNGLIIGTGNNLMDGKSFGDAFSEGGLNQAFTQGLGGIAFGGLMGTLDAMHSNEDWLTGSPYKRYAYTNGEKTMTSDAATTRNMTEVKKEASVELPKTDQAYTIEVDAPRGWNMTDGNFQYSTDEQLFSIQQVTKNNSQMVQFPVGTPNGGYYAARISQPARIIHNGKLVLFHSNKRDFGTLFWYLKILQK